MIAAKVRLYQVRWYGLALASTLLGAVISTGCSLGSAVEAQTQPKETPEPTSEFQPLPENVARALIEAGFNPAVVTVAQPGAEPVVLVDPSKASFLPDPVTQPRDVKLGGEELGPGVRLIYYTTGSTRVTQCPPRPSGGDWNCRRVKTP